ncbi:MAG: hypothetical protein HYW47_05105 [Deltaproteobacteria bacterium]|nr:hypothetical protein [Deltaproteobacteria bacterium]
MNKLSFYIHEISGALGDLPLFFILIVGLSQHAGFNPLSILFWSGLCHIVIGFIFKIPLPLQPMKAMGLYAITYGVSQGELLLAGFCLGVVILILNDLHLFEKLYRFFPQAVIRGIQLGLGIVFLKKAFELIFSTPSPLMGEEWGEGVLIGILFFFVIFFLFFFFHKLQFLLTFLIFGFGIFVLSDSGVLAFPHIGFSLEFLQLPLLSSPDSFMSSSTQTILLLILIQLPLTMANSIFSPALLIQDEFPQSHVGVSEISKSVGLVNLLTCPFGGMPSCHGAGGLAAQMIFGARTGFSIVFLGFLKITVALLLGSFFLTLATHFPKPLLGILFIFPAFDLCKRAFLIRGFKEVVSLVATSCAFVFWHAGGALLVGSGVYYGVQYLRKGIYEATH